MALTYEPIATVTGSTVSFQNIPQTYTDLILVCGFGEARFNNVTTGGLYSQTFITGEPPSGVTANRISNANSGYLNYSGVGGPAFNIVHIFNYTNTSMNKTYLSITSADNNGSGFVSRTAGLFRSTAAITRIDLANAYSNGPHTLYGIKSA